LSPIDGDARAEFKLPGGLQGVVVTDVAPDSLADEKNLRVGDVIVSVQDQPVRTPDDVSRRVDADAKAGKRVEILLVNRSGSLNFVALRLT
jgi:serine protease Do